MPLQLDGVDRPTPAVTVDAIIMTVRERGLVGLKDADTMERLSRCDDRARDEINERLAKLLKSGDVKELADEQA